MLNVSLAPKQSSFLGLYTDMYLSLFLRNRNHVLAYKIPYKVLARQCMRHLAIQVRQAPKPEIIRVTFMFDRKVMSIHTLLDGLQ